MNGKRQKNLDLQALAPKGRGEPSVGGDEGTETFVAKPTPQSPAYMEQQLMEEVCNRGNEPPRVCRRPFCLSHAAMAGSSSCA